MLIYYRINVLDIQAEDFFSTEWTTHINMVRQAATDFRNTYGHERIIIERKEITTFNFSMKDLNW